MINVFEPPLFDHDDVIKWKCKLEKGVRYMVAQTLKEKLLSIDDFQKVPNEYAHTLLDEMLKHIGSPDTKLRDELIYIGLATWIMNEKFHQAQLKQLYNKVLNDDFLFYQIGKDKDDSVFTRSFSVLILPPLLEVHKKSSFLSRGDVVNGLKCVNTYIIKEQDSRGYIPEKGWAHSLAHAADALESFASLEEIEEQDLIPVLEGIKYAISRPLPYYHGEDERLINALETMLPKVPDCFIIEWIESFESILSKVESPYDDVVHFNIKTFLRSFYFRLLWKREERYREAILSTLESIEELGAY